MIADDVRSLLGRPKFVPGTHQLDREQADLIDVAVSAVTDLAAGYTRGRGFIEGEPSADIRSVIVLATARLLSNPGGLLYSESEGPSSVEFRSAFNGWTVSERVTLDRYRVKAV